MKNKKKVLITQSNYIPWKGYFDAIQFVDEVILYDDMQYTKRDWRNRNKISTPNGLKWLSIPVSVKGKYFQAINETKVSENNWQKKHWTSIKHNYNKAPYFKEYENYFEKLFLNCKEEYISLINLHFIIGINKILNINTPIRFSSDFDLIEGKTEKLIDLCKKVNATDYYSGPSAKSYINKDLFDENNINLHYFDFNNYPEYQQLNTPFEHGVTILDLIFNTGLDVSNYMKNINSTI